MSKEARAKFYSVYLRPWTLAKSLATTLVPFLKDLAETTAGTNLNDEDLNTYSTRRPWKKSFPNIFPHAERGVRNFMLTCLAEFRGTDDDDEKNQSKGPAVVCDLSLNAVHE